MKHKQRTKSLESFIAQASKIHKGKYDYSRIVGPVSSRAQVEIVCPIHGPFMKVVGHHLAGMGCKKCEAESREAKRLDKS
jgi:hypothetical protein